MDPFTNPGQQTPSYDYALVAQYPYGPPQSTPKAGTIQTVGFTISVILQLVLGAVMVFFTMLAPLAYDSCGSQCDTVDRWMRMLVALCIFAGTFGLSSIISWFFKRGVAWILSSLVWLTMLVWFGVVISGSA